MTKLIIFVIQNTTDETQDSHISFTRLTGAWHSRYSLQNGQKVQSEEVQDLSALLKSFLLKALFTGCKIHQLHLSVGKIK